MKDINSPFLLECAMTLFDSKHKIENPHSMVSKGNLMMVVINYSCSFISKSLHFGGEVLIGHRCVLP